MWTLIKGKPENYGRLTNNEVCEHCGSTRLDPQSAISDKTFDPVRAKKRKVK